MSISIREATASDAAALLILFNSAYHAESGDIAPGFKLTTRFLSESEVESVLQRGPLLIAEQSGSVAGALAFEIIPDASNTPRAHFGPFATARAFRGTGVGSALLAALETRARAAGCASLDGEVVNLRYDLFPLYFKLGFRVVGRADFPAPERVSRPVHFVLIRRAIAAPT